MPTWNLTYQIGRDCTQEDFYREQQIFLNDPLCVSYESTDSAGYQAVQVRFNESMGEESLRVLQLRRARIVPAVSTNPITWNGNRHEVIMSTESSQGDQLVIGASVSIDEHGRLGGRGTPIGIISRMDTTNNSVHIIIEPRIEELAALQVSLHTADPGPSGNQTTSEVAYTGYARVAVNRANDGTAGWTVTTNSATLNDPRRFSPEELETFRTQLERRPYLIQNSRFLQERQQLMAEEDARVFRILDNIAQEESSRPPLPNKSKSEPRPIPKTRYKRIMEALKGE
jgi:hypothetical protein